MLEVKADGPADVDKLFHLLLRIGTVIILVSLMFNKKLR